MYGDRLSEIRKTLKLTQEEISAQTGISYRAYTSYERGDRKPSLEFLEKIEKLYNVNLNWLIADDGVMFNQKYQSESGSSYSFSSSSGFILKSELYPEVIKILKSEGILK